MAKNLILNTIWSISYKFDMKGLFCYFFCILSWITWFSFSLIQETFRRFIFVFNYEIGGFLKYKLLSFSRITSLLLKNFTCSNCLLKLIEFFCLLYNKILFHKHRKSMHFTLIGWRVWQFYIDISLFLFNVSVLELSFV